MKKIAVVVLGLLLVAGAAHAQGRGKRTPPPEAYEACEGKAAGDAASFTSPRGDEVTGICQEREGRLVLHPDGPPPERQPQ